MVAHLVFVGGEVAVPEQRNLLDQRSLGGKHPVRPPVSDTVAFKRTDAQPEKELVDHGLGAPVAAWFDLHADRLAACLRSVGGLRAALGEGIDAGVGNARWLERHRARVDHALRSYQTGDGSTRAVGKRALDVARARAESGALEKVRRALGVPLRFVDRPQVVDPVTGQGTGRLALRRRGPRPEQQCKDADPGAPAVERRHQTGGLTSTLHPRWCPWLLIVISPP